ncbi:hypothetical protein P43SY_003645 [Pythium insidiosum]|uniref:Inosine/uridine-preferring nucleoside hydrolase domain-containing protein n=1 Tax=Pythium insidiosum TaxID=114742 RepID=A0AAD5Q8R6_PYTIN|nr:hypothetical protein P43SY_003645 [Pythium insidiosum]
MARIVIDTDAGVDDAVAVLLTLHGFPRDAVLGITTVFGNVDLHQANHNVAHMLQAVGREDVPIFSGAARPISSCVSDERWPGHGPDGLGGEAGVVEAAATASRKNTAVHALIDLAHRYKGELIVVALGPLTNVALAMLLDPDFVDNVKQFVIMGGLSRGEGNLTPHCEFNVGCDPEATDIVYQHCTADQLHIVPFETITDHDIPWTKFDEIFDAGKSPAAAYIKRVWAHTRKVSQYGFMPCDAYAVAMLLHPKYVTTAKRLRGRIHLGHDEQRGNNVWVEDDENANVTVVTHVDVNIFCDLLSQLVA